MIRQLAMLTEVSRLENISRYGWLGKKKQESNQQPQEEDLSPLC